ncbi:probably inactive leucine-rich repeat receptor-like protein kinase At5g06940 [Andrographis paniculata]|uniref:probably inactive leucine-rich repeat receptor-like protein kinase At5g06940 n=1 Tax=Andrographis paniculata TaxID=175694 RepID=UPI0021E6E86E|nr:probably inactive leucine-rich repeat receptor-like protein kinase At5g06940 [Andrographis paniculata]
MATTWKHKLLLSLMFTLFQLNPTAYSESESKILLQFKASIKDPMNALSSWSNTTAIHHCNWTGVSCTSSQPFLVSALSLQSLNLSGAISASICELPNLATLNLADNHFNQPIPLHLSQCTSLEALNLSNNLIWGSIPEQISQFKSVKVIDFSGNRIEGRVPESIGSLQQLQVLNFGSNLLTGNLPQNTFGNFTELVVLDVSQNPFLVSEIPADIGGLSKLKHLVLQGSGFYGEIPNIFKGLRSLTVLDLSQNNLTGTLPQIDLFLPNIVSFDVSQNRLAGTFPKRLCGAKGITTLSLHTNYFTGSISNYSINECLNLESFQVQNNGFGGDFPSLLWSLPKIKLIRAENNRFSGEIPDSISEAAQLEHVQIDNNSFVSRLPPGVGKVRSLYRFSASMNGLFGELPPSFCDSPVMSIVSLAHNHFSGRIPEVRKCRKLVSLSLAGNSFIGGIPECLAELPVLTYLDLSENNLTGLIPPGLENLKLALFNVSFNQLSGRVPMSLISGLPASYLQGNPGLCGPGLPKPCLSDDDDKSSTGKPSGFAILTCALVFVAVALALMVSAYGFYLIRCHKRKAETGIWRALFFYPLRITEHDLIISMDEKAFSVGPGGTFGRVYVVKLPRSGELIAVKKIVNFASQSSKSLKNEMKTLAKIRHKNIVKILGFCYSADTIFLISEYMPKGSLGDMLGKQDFDLPWSVRLGIAIGIAQGLAYLHRDYLPRVLNRNLKSSNVLLDDDFQPKLADFGLDRIVGENAFQWMVAASEPAAASSCYVAPEYGHTKRATEQMDTYSFGVVLLELLTGRQAEAQKPWEPCGVDVVKWVRRKVNITDGPMKVVDPKILGSSSTQQQQILEALQIGLHCTSVMPEKRPSMPQVVKALESLALPLPLSPN